MTLSELNGLIADLVNLRQKSELALNSRIEGVDLIKDQTDIIKQDCALLQKKVLIAFEALSRDEFQIEADPEVNDLIQPVDEIIK